MAEGRTKKNFQSNTSVWGSALSKTFLLSLSISHLFQVILNNLIFNHSQSQRGGLSRIDDGGGQ